MHVVIRSMAERANSEILTEMMDERTFNDLADAELSRIERALEEVAGAFDLEVKADGMLDLEFDNGVKIIINRHSPAREIWIASRSGGFHFHYVSGRWLGTRNGVELFDALSSMMSEISGSHIVLRRPPA